MLVEEHWERTLSTHKGLPIVADGGGSNGARNRLFPWGMELYHSARVGGTIILSGLLKHVEAHNKPTSH